MAQELGEWGPGRKDTFPHVLVYSINWILLSNLSVLNMPINIQDTFLNNPEKSLLLRRIWCEHTYYVI